MLLMTLEARRARDRRTTTDTAYYDCADSHTRRVAQEEGKCSVAQKKLEMRRVRELEEEALQRL